MPTTTNIVKIGNKRFSEPTTFEFLVYFDPLTKQRLHFARLKVICGIKVASHICLPVLIPVLLLNTLPLSLAELIGGELLPSNFPKRKVRFKDLK